MGSLSWAYLLMSLPDKNTEWCNPNAIISEWILCTSLLVLLEDKDFENIE